MGNDSFNKLATRFASTYGRENIRDVYTNIINKSDLAPIKDDPKTAVALLEHYNLIGLETGQAARALDVIMGEIPEKDQAGEILKEHLTQRRKNELLGYMDGVFSTAAFVADVESIIKAIESDLASEAGTPEDLKRQFQFIILSWAYRLKDRDDYSELLDRQIHGIVFLDWLLISIWLADNLPNIDILSWEITEPIPVTRFTYFGIDGSTFGSDIDFPKNLFSYLALLITAYEEGKIGIGQIIRRLQSVGPMTYPIAVDENMATEEDELGLDMSGEAEEENNQSDESGEDN